MQGMQPTLYSVPWTACRAETPASATGYYGGRSRIKVVVVMEGMEGILTNCM